MQNIIDARVVILGAEAVGKTYCISRFCLVDFNDSYLPTIGVDFKRRNIKTSSGTNLKICYWDISGHQKFKSIIALYIDKHKFVILVFDITNRNSFNELKPYIEVCDEKEGKKLILIGNKSDLKEIRQVSAEEAREFAKANGMAYFETSAKHSIGFDPAHDFIVQKIMESNPPTAEQTAKILKPDPRQPIPRPANNLCCNFLLNVLINLANVITLFIPYLVMACMNNKNYYQENKNARGSYFKFYGKYEVLESATKTFDSVYSSN